MAKIVVIHDNSHRAAQAEIVAAKLANRDCKRNIIITVGREVVDKAIAAKGEGDVLVSILDPGRDYEKFDLIFVPEHDPHPDLPNIRTTIGLINRITPELLSQQHIPHLMRDLRRPRVERRVCDREGVAAVLVGGKHVGGNFLVGDAAHLAALLNANGGAAMITTSKRTEDAAVATLKDAVKIPHVIFDYNHDGLAANPYPAMLGSVDKIIVTADSVRMCSEACSSGKPVFIFTPQQTHFSYIALRDSLFKAGAALDVAELGGGKKTVVLDEAKKAADEIIEYIGAL